MIIGEEKRADQRRRQEKLMSITLKPLAESDREQFILDNQEAFNYGALEEFGKRDDHFEEDGQIISRATIEKSIDAGEAYRIVRDGQIVGGVVIKVEADQGELDLYLSHLRLTAKASATLRGAQLNSSTLKSRSGKL